MKKRNHSAVSHGAPGSVGDTYDNAIWSLETISFRGNEAVRSFGTGFLFKREARIRGRKYVRYYLVSNKHVLVEDSPSILLLRFPPQGNQPSLRYRLYPSYEKAPDKLQTVVRQDPSADLAIIDVTDKIQNGVIEAWARLAHFNFLYETINLSNIPSKFDFEKGTPMEYVGYPDRSDHPRLKKGYIGRNPKDIADSNIELDNILVAQGASGSPAFIEVEGKSKLLGVMYATESTQVVEGHREFDQGHAVKSTRLIELTNEMLEEEGFNPKDINKFTR